MLGDKALLTSFLSWVAGEARHYGRKRNRLTLCWPRWVEAVAPHLNFLRDHQGSVVSLSYFLCLVLLSLPLPSIDASTLLCLRLWTRSSSCYWMKITQDSIGLTTSPCFLILVVSGAHGLKRVPISFALSTIPARPSLPRELRFSLHRSQYNISAPLL